MFLFDDNDGSLHWGCDQIMHKNNIYEITEGRVSITVAPVFNMKNTPKICSVSCCVAGMRESEIQANVEHLQDGTDVLVIRGESEQRATGRGVVYQHAIFQRTFILPKDTDIESKSVYFHEGLLIVSFDKLKSE